MKDVEFKEYSAKYKDADGDEHTSTVRAHVADKETADILGTVLSHAGPHVVRNGDVLIETERPHFYNVQTGKAWDEAGYVEGDGSSAPVVNDDSKDEDNTESSNSADSDSEDNTTPTRTSRRTTATQR